MQDATNEAFIRLFKEAFKKCFGADLHTTLSETECKHFSNQILEETGLVIGAKSLKNYSSYTLNPDEAKPEKPSVATLDTLARYVLNAPYTNEIKRKEKEAHYPYWFQYRNQFAVTKTSELNTKENITQPTQSFVKVSRRTIVFTFVFIALVVLSIIYFLSVRKSEVFTDNFHSVDNDSLQANGWFLQSEDKLWWNKRNAIPSHLTLYTLQGDNWTDSTHAPVIKNLLVRKIPSDCFTAEVHFDSFVPMRRWQQAGILLLEDTSLSSKSLRISVAYNDFFGGYNRPKEIIVQAISSAGGTNTNHPEEIIHLPMFSIEPGQDSLVANNLRKSALRIEKNGVHFRFLYATGEVENFAFKEALSKDLLFQPKYIGIFALEGFVDETNYIPAFFKYFSLVANPCAE